MSYINHFKHADDIIAHLNVVFPTINDPILKLKYIGFVTVAINTVYELAIKEIFIEFAKKKHKVLGYFIETHFERINGRIKIKVIEDEYIRRFGAKYKNKFSKKLDAESKRYLLQTKRDIISSYSNLITWRNDFAHEGKISSNATYNEVVQAYQDGKEVIRLLAESMQR